MENYRILEAIGEGSFGRVFRGMCRKTSGIVALKFIPKRNKVERELQSLRRECDIQKELFHPNIVRMVDSFETEQEVVAVSEFVPNQLFSILEQHGTLSEERVKKIACNLVSAIYYLHSLRILHRDIKPQNILLTANGEAKLCDFGFSRKMGINTYVLTSIKGTPLYMAPELIEENPYDHTADLWSLGCILFELLTGKPPFSTSSLVQLIKMVRLEPIRWPSNISAECLSFLEGLLQKEPSQRLSWPDLLQHPWVKDNVTVLDNTVDAVPLTSPLSSSQQLIKEEQKKFLIHQGLSQPKILKNLTRRYFSKPKYIAQHNEASFYNSKVLAAHSVDHIKNNFCFKNEAFRLEACDVPTCNVNPSESASVPTEISCIETPNEENNSISHTDNNTNDVVVTQEAENDPIFPPHSVNEANAVDAREPIGSSVRKMSTFSQESGFKEEDISDFRSVGVLPSEKRKDSMVNYLSNSVDSSRRENRPSFPNFEMGGLSDLPNINEESGDYVDEICKRVDDLPLNDIEKPIEGEEWSTFLDKILVEVVGENFDIYLQQSELTMFLSPLQNSSCPLFVTEKVLTILIMPFVLIKDKSVLQCVFEGYLQCKIIPNLIYAFKLMMKQSMVIHKGEYSKETFKVLKLLVALICNLVYSSNSFISQFCEAVCIPSTCRIFGKLFSSDIEFDIIEKLIAILNQILRFSPENKFIVEDILSLESAYSFVRSLVCHESATLRASVCSLIGYAAVYSCSFLEMDKQLIQDIINLERDNIENVKRAAAFAVTSLGITYSKAEVV